MNIGPLESKFWNSRIMRVSGHRILSAGSAHVKVADQRSKSVGFWQMALLTAAGTLGAASQADAALFYYQDSDSGYSRPTPSAQPRRQRNARKNSAGKHEAAEKETGAKPQGPLIIAISIDKQKVRVYDSNGLFAESPVSTGMKGHSTPMGVFSIIQKHKFHHSCLDVAARITHLIRLFTTDSCRATALLSMKNLISSLHFAAVFFSLGWALGLPQEAHAQGVEGVTITSIEVVTIWPQSALGVCSTIGAPTSCLLPLSSPRSWRICA